MTQPLEEPVAARTELADWELIRRDGWTPARVAMLGRLVEAGHSASLIAARLGGGITRNAVLGKMLRLRDRAAGRDRRSEGRQPGEPRKKPTKTVRSVARFANVVRHQVREESDPDDEAQKRAGKWSLDAPQRVAAPDPKPLPIARTIVLPPEPQMGDGIDLLLLAATTCKWPITDGPPYRFCGAEKPSEGSPYCSWHHSKAHV